jgi:S1-C subfamily serine protease
MLLIKCFVRLLLCMAIVAGMGAEIVRGGESLVPSPQSPAPLLLDFYSDWCGPCQAMTPTVESLTRAGYVVQRVNVDDNPSLARQYGVTSIPCFVAVANGGEVDRVVGECSYQRLERMLKPSRVPLAQPVPRPAWRYEQPVGHRAAVVRIYCQDDARTRSIGSGTLIRWNGRIVVLTARHVVQDAKQIIVELVTKRTHWAKVLKVDAVWDCAVLELAGEPVGVEPVEVELGKDAKFSEGDRLESCGYGADGKLACNSGLFISYRRAGPNATADDWMEISGHARQGDSGGGVFNAHGRLVGVLWGTDGKSVVCVQPGRIHLLLDEAVPRHFDRQAFFTLTALVRNPTPPQEPEITLHGPSVPVAPSCCPAGKSCDETAYGKPSPILGWRDGAQKKDSDLERRQRELLQALEAERQARLATPPQVSAQPPVKSEAAPDAEPSPLLVGLGIVAGAVAGFVIYFATQKS